jgi:hypothetical protein
MVLLWAVAGGILFGSVAVLSLWMSTGPALVFGAVILGMAFGVLVRLGSDGNRRIRRLGRRRRDMDHLTAALSDLPTRDQVTSLVQRTVYEARNRLHGDISQLGIAVRDDNRQLEALLNLHAMIPVRQALPRSRGWAASPDLLLTYVGSILERRPSLVLECGSGLSTLWAALALEVVGGRGRVVALEHDASFREDTLAALRAHGVAHRAEVRYAPIRTVTVDGGSYPWYDTDALDDVSGVGVLFVDGPIGDLGPQSRYPALPLLRDSLEPGALILLDDADRPEEREVLTHWQADWPELTCEVLKLEKGAARLLVPGRHLGHEYDATDPLSTHLDSVTVREKSGSTTSG